MDEPDPEDDPEDDDGPARRWPFYAVVLAVLAVITLLTAWVAGGQSSAPTGDGGTDAVRLGPAAGETVAGYLARVRVPPPGSSLALVQFDRPLGAAAALGALGGSRAAPLQVVFRVSLPRVQTAVRRETLSPGADPLTAVRAAEVTAAADARAQADGETDRPATIARAESSALGAHCDCVLALVVRTTGTPVAVAPPVRAVEAAPPDARPDALAVSPLLPEQTDVVGPVPDDGPVPP